MNIRKDGGPNGDRRGGLALLGAGNHALSATADQQIRTKCLGQHLRKHLGLLRMVSGEEHTGEIDRGIAQLCPNVLGHSLSPICCLYCFREGCGKLQGCAS